MKAINSMVTTDRIHCTNVVYNLIDNALKYNTKNPEITISTKKQSNHIELSIKDNGIGIPKNYQKRIFDKFYRVPTGDIHNVKGFGIGLNYVKSIVDEHNWRIQISSEPNIGSTFTLQIPVSA